MPRGGDEKRGQMLHPPSTLQHFSLIAQSNNAVLSILGCVQLGNMDLDFENPDFGFAIEREIRKRIFTVRLGNPKKDLKNRP